MSDHDHHHIPGAPEHDGAAPASCEGVRLFVTCPACVRRKPDEIDRLLLEAGVTGAALAEVHDMLLPCEPDAPCVGSIVEAVEEAATRLADLVEPGRGRSARPLAALLAVLDQLAPEPLELISSGIRHSCASRCHRRAPGGRLWRRAMLQVREQLIGAGEGNVLVIMAGATRAGPVLEVGVRGADEDETGVAPADAFRLAPGISAHLPGLADRLLTLSRLAIVKGLAPRDDDRGRTPPLRVDGLRVRGDAWAWSRFHNAIAMRADRR